MDYAIISLKGHQYLIKEGEELIIDRMEADQGEEIDIEDVLLAKNGDIMVGKPKLKDVKIKAKVIEHFKGDKIKVVKFRRKKRYQKTKGFRPQLTKLKIEKIAHGKN